MWHISVKKYWRTTPGCRHGRWEYRCSDKDIIVFLCLSEPAEVFSHSVQETPERMSPVTIETFSPSLASAHSLAPSEMHTTLSARFSQHQPEGGALAAVMLRLYSREFSEKHIPTRRWVAVRSGEERRGENTFRWFYTHLVELSPEDLSTLLSKSSRLLWFLLNDVEFFSFEWHTFHSNFSCWNPLSWCVFCLRVKMVWSFTDVTVQVTLFI